MKILTITSNDQSISWGPAVHYQELWNGFSEKYKNIDIIGIAPSWTNSSVPILKNSFKLIQIKVPNIRMIRQIIYDYFVAIALLKNRKSIIYIRLSHFHFFSYLIIKLFDIKYFLELNGILKDDAKHSNSPIYYQKFVSWMEKKMIRSATGCISVSEGVDNNARKLGCKNSVVINNGVSTKLFDIDNSSYSLKKIIYVGTFTPWDGHQRILELALQYPEIEFLFAGDGLEATLIKNSKLSNVRFLGYIEYSKLAQLYESVDAAIVLYDKGFRNNMKLSSLKTLEYIASGLPIFSTNVPGQEFIFDNEIGFEATEDLSNDFQEFIKGYLTYKSNIDVYRKKHKNKLSWIRCVKDTYRFLFDEKTKSKGR